MRWEQWGVASVAILSLWSAEALAVCTPPAPVNNAQVTCTGVTINQNGADGYGTGLDNGNTITVLGGASVTGTFAGVIFNTGTVLNSGSISGGTVGIVGLAAINLTNLGTISSTLTSVITLGDATIVNTGAIASSGGGAISVSNGVSLLNSGTITGATIGVAAGNGTVVNSGTIAGANIAGVAFIGAGGSLSNSGTIAGSTAFSAGGSANLTNSGTLIGNSGNAIAFSGAADTLTLLPGSRIVGAINMGGGADVVNVRSGPDMSWLVTLTNFTGTVNNIGPGPMVVAGSQIATLDPTSFALADRALGDFTRGITGVIAGRFGEAGVPGGAPLALAAPDGLATWYGEMFEAMAYAGTPVFKAPTQVSREGTTVWARAFGGHRDHDGTDITLPAISTFGGGAVGIDHPFAHNIRLGAFVGGGATRVNIAASAGGTDTDILFGGIYGGWRGGNFFIDAALHGGHLDNRNTRRIANNLAPGGFETATASYDGWYLSPELGAGIRFALAPEWSLTPTARVRYVHADLDGYAETGSAANLTVAGRTLENLEERFDLTLSRRQAFATGDTLTTSIHAGVLGLHRLGGDTVNTVLLGVNLPFATPGEDNVAGLYAGAGFEWRQKQNVSFFGAGEIIAMSDDSTVIHGKGGLRVAF